MISNELLSIVLNCDIQSVRESPIDNNELAYGGNLMGCFWDGCINKDTLCRKCKDFIMENSNELKITYRRELCIAEIEFETIEFYNSKNWDSELNTVMKAAEYVANKKGLLK